MNAASSHPGLHPSSTPLQSASSEAAVRLRAMLGGVFSGRDLTRPEAAELLGYVFDGQATDAQIAAVLVALAKKGECVDEIVGLTEAMRARMVVLRTRHQCFVDTAGTGASRAKAFNISTAAAIVAAAAGVPVAKHGARAATSKTGSADVLAAMGAPIPVPLAISEQLFDSLGFCFLFAPAHHPASARVAGIRRELGVRTCFNLIGPLCNPARSRRQLMGVSDPKLMSMIAERTARAGRRARLGGARLRRFGRGDAGRSDPRSGVAGRRGAHPQHRSGGLRLSRRIARRSARGRCRGQRAHHPRGLCRPSPRCRAAPHCGQRRGGALPRRSR